MNTKRTGQWLIAWMMIVGVVAQSAFAKEVGLEERLNADIKISLSDVLITEALEKIGSEIGVAIRISDEAKFKLPYGKSTRLSVTLKGPASESLTQMLNEFFMRYAVGADEIVIYPRPELDHIIGRPSTRQLQVLKALYTKPITVYITNNASATLNTALEQDVFVSPISYQGGINKALRKLAGEKRVNVSKKTDKYIWLEALPLDAEGKEAKEYALPTPVTVPLLLREFTHGNSPVEWYIPSIDLPNQVPEIRVAKKGTLRGLNYIQLIDINFEDTALLEIFQSLGKRGNIKFEKKPRTLSDLEECVTVSMQNVTAMQAMKQIADMAKFRYDSSGDEFYIEEKVTPPQPRTRMPGRGGGGRSSRMSDADAKDSGQYVGKISIPMDGGAYYIEYMLRESDLTDELKKLRSEKIKEILGSPEKQEPQKEAAKESK